jgi:hypothetical protein
LKDINTLTIAHTVKNPKTEYMAVG